MSDTPPPGLLQTLPTGFELLPDHDTGWTLRYRTSGMGCVGWFFGFWLTLWTVGCIVGTVSLFREPRGFDPWMALFMVPFWAAEFGVAGFVAWYFWAVTEFQFGPDELVYEKSLGRFRRRHVLPRRRIQTVRQVKDGGEGEDSFPSWGLIVSTTEPLVLLHRQPIEKSRWLGQIIAAWAGVKFHEA